MAEIVTSPMGARVRLTDERWAHIVEAHDDLANHRQDVLETVRHPDLVVAGRVGELLAIREIEASRWLVVVYRQMDRDGFIITAYPDKPDSLVATKGASMALKDLTEYLSMAPKANQFPNSSLKSSYDEEADVLYIRFDPSIPVTDSELTDEDIILRYHGDDLVGMTILHASQR